VLSTEIKTYGVVMKYLLLSFICLIFIVGCGGSNTSEPIPAKPTPVPAPTPAPPPAPPPAPQPTPPELGYGLFSETELWGNDVAYRTVATQEKNLIEKVTYSKSGLTCLIKKQTNIDTIKPKAEWPSTVECLNNSGETVFSHQPEGTGIVKDILFKADNSLVIAELIDLDKSNTGFERYYLQLIHYSASGVLINKKILIDEPNQDELYYYSVEDGYTTRKIIDDLANGDKPLLPSSSLVKLALHQDEIYLLAYTYGIKAYHLTDKLTVNWDVQVMPAVPYLWINMLQSKADMTISAEGEIFVAFDLWAEDIEAYNMHFDRQINIAQGQGGIAVEVFNATGEYQRSLSLDDANQTENLVAIIHHNQSLWLGANVRIAKENARSSSTEWDMLLAEISPEAGDTLGYHFIHHDKEDIARDLKLMPNDNFIFSGSTGFVQVDTNSIVSYGSGFLLEVSPAGQSISLAVLSQPRDTDILSIDVIESNLIMFAGQFDGPITHTCDSDRNKCYQSGVVGIARLTPLIP